MMKFGVLKLNEILIISLSVIKISSTINGTIQEPRDGH